MHLYLVFRAGLRKQVTNWEVGDIICGTSVPNSGNTFWYRVYISPQTVLNEDDEDVPYMT